MSVFDDPALFGRQWADVYDTTDNPDPSEAVDFLAGMADGGPVLELAIGTGRVALPLVARGLAVEGVEGSPEMVTKLHGKPGGDAIAIAIGDMAEVPVSGRFRLVYLVFNTLFNLVRDERQRDLFHNVARVLEPGGAFVVETFVPDPDDFDRDEQLVVRQVTEESVTMRVHRYDRKAQTFVRQTIVYANDGVRLFPFAMRYLWPEQIDAMAVDAGLTLAERHADFVRTPFEATSRSHVSVYRAPA
jgi:SAM-dependent methyltransferase